MLHLPDYQKMIALGVLIALLAVGYYYVSHAPKALELEAYQQELTKLNAQYSEQQRVLANIENFRQELRGMQAKFEEALKETMLKIRNIVSHDFLIIFISDFMRYSPEVIKFISHLAQHNDVILAKVFDPMERDIPAAKVIAGDGEKQIVMDGESKRLREKFQEGFDHDYTNFETQMKKHRIPLMKIDTIAAVDEQLKEVFKGTKR